jgi:hypothetical protein
MNTSPRRRIWQERPTFCVFLQGVCGEIGANGCAWMKGVYPLPVICYEATQRKPSAHGI